MEAIQPTLDLLTGSPFNPSPGKRDIIPYNDEEDMPLVFNKIFDVTADGCKPAGSPVCIKAYQVNSPIKKTSLSSRISAKVATAFRNVRPKRLTFKKDVDTSKDTVELTEDIKPIETPEPSEVDSDEAVEVSTPVEEKSSTGKSTTTLKKLAKKFRIGGKKKTKPQVELTETIDINFINKDSLSTALKLHKKNLPTHKKLFRKLRLLKLKARTNRISHRIDRKLKSAKAPTAAPTSPEIPIAPEIQNFFYFPPPTEIEEVLEVLGVVEESSLARFRKALKPSNLFKAKKATDVPSNKTSLKQKVKQASKKIVSCFSLKKKSV